MEHLTKLQDRLQAVENDLRQLPPVCLDDIRQAYQISRRSHQLRQERERLQDLIFCELSNLFNDED